MTEHNSVEGQGKITLDYSYQSQSILVRFSTYKLEWVNACKSLPSYKYIKNKNVWVIPASDYYLLIKKFSPFESCVYNTARMEQFAKDESHYHIVEKIPKKSKEIDLNFVID